MTVLYSILHLLVDGLCAMAMFGRYIPGENGYFYILLYNFCAFALQMPFGVMLDAMNAKKENGKRKPDYAYITAALGVLCTIAGVATHPLVLGIGNALFHVGGGVGTICEDSEKGGRGTRLGIFVAPGALGLYLGTIIAAGNGAGGFGWNQWFAGTGIFLLALLMVGKLYLQERIPEFKTDGHSRRKSVCRESDQLHLRRESTCRESDQLHSRRKSVCRESDQLHSQPESICGENSLLQNQSVKGAIILSVCSLLVVVLRSYIGMAVEFPWKTGVLAGLLSVFALVGGKMAGGFLAAWRGAFRTAVVSLTGAAFCYLFSSLMPMGLAALFLFNMTMPITLYWMICAFPQMPGFAFGFLTVPMEYMKVVYDHISFQEDYGSEIVEQSGVLEEKYRGEDIWVWEYPGAKEYSIVPLNMPDLPEYISMYTDERGYNWGYVGYYYARRNFWICIDQPTADYEQLYPDGEPQIVAQAEAAETDSFNSGKQGTDRIVPEPDHGPVIIATVLVALVVLATAGLLVILKKRK